MKVPATQKAMFVGNVVMFMTLLTVLLTGAGRQTPSVLSVERLNVVDSTGALALVLSSAARLPGGTFGGREYPQAFVGRGRSAGMIFFNEVGDEVGGLIYEGHQQDSSYQAFGHLSFDQWKQNQVVAVQYQDNGEARGAGLRVWDRPTEVPLEAQFALAAEMLAAPAGRVRDSLNAARLQVREQVQGTPRLFVGSQNRKALLELRDTEGRVRIEMAVDSMGTAQLTFFDSEGRVTGVYR
jgi:hypothetical protein